MDGDTFDLRITLGFGIDASFRFRLYGCNAPELSTDEGKEAKKFVEEWLAGRKLIAKTYKGSSMTLGLGDGAFGRWLADVIDYDTQENLADALCEKGWG